MNDEQAQQEISVITFSLTLISLMLPVVTVWLAGKFTSVTVWMLEHGLLEKSERVVWALHDGIGLDLGRILILAGLSLLIMLALGWFIKLSVETSKSQNAA